MYFLPDTIFRYLVGLLFYLLFSCSIYSFSLQSDKMTSFKEDTLLISYYLNQSEKFIESVSVRDSAIYFLNKALDVSDKWETNEHLYEIYSRFTDLYRKSGNYSVALDYAFKMLKILDKEDQKKDHLYDTNLKYESLYRDIGFYLHFSDLDKALFYLKKSLEYSDQLFEMNPEYPINKSRIITYNNIGSMFMDADRMDSAEVYYEQVLPYVQEMNDPVYNATIFNNIGIINWEQGRYEEADHYLSQSVALKKQLKDTAGLASSYLNLGKFSYIQGDYQEALSRFCTSLDYSRKSMNVRIEALALESLSQVYETLGDHEKSNEFLKASVVMNDSLNSTDKIRFGLATEMQYEFEKRKEESDLKQQVLLANKERDILTAVLIACFLLFVLILLIFLYRNQRLKTKKNIIEKETLALRNENLNLKNQKLEQNLAIKGKELNMHAKYLLQKKESANLALEQISQLKKEQAEDIGIDLEEVKANLEESVWNEFKILFQNLHHDFYVNLHQTHPNLTPNEKKLCTFIRLNMSTKEISAITSQQTKTIEIARSRLRTKMGLQRQDNLTSYLQQF